MAVRSSANVGFFLANGYNLVGYLTQFSDEIEAVTDDAMTLGDTWPEPTDTGNRDARLTQEGFFDDAALASIDAYQANLGASAVLCYTFAPNVVGNQFEGWSGAVETKYRRTSERKKLNTVSAEYSCSGTVETGLILHELSAETADGNTKGADSIDNGAATAYGASVYLQVTALTLDGGTALQVDVLHSSDDSTYVTLSSFTAVTTAPTAERKTVAAAASTPRRHLACQWDFTGTPGGNATATFMVGCRRLES